jgi:hypothetical protein
MHWSLQVAVVVVLEELTKPDMKQAAAEPVDF